jgi:AraC-like DNA-binding protein
VHSELLQHYQMLDREERLNLEYCKAKGTYPVEQRSYSAKYLLRDGSLIKASKHRRFEWCQEHTHDYVEMVYMCTGQTIHLVNGIKIILRAGELLLLNQHAMHKNFPAEEGDLAVNLIILPQFFDITLAMMGDNESDLRKFLIGCLQNENQAGGFLHFKVADVPQVQNLVESLLWTHVRKEQNRRSIDQFNMGLLFLFLLNHTDKIHSGSKQDDLTFKILQYVEDHYSDGTLGELAEALDYDPEWLSTNIKRLTGSTFTELQQDKRIFQAKILLSTTALPVKEIAAQVGYSNTSYFFRLFREREGCSPKDYRRGNETA